jgi:hypothetical protein
MKKIIAILLLTVLNTHADYSATGSADSKGAAYVEAMGKAPSGSYWILNRISYGHGYLNRYTCTIIWTQK